MPADSGLNVLDSAQAQAVFTAAQHFPNGSQISICIITPGSECYAGIERRNDSLLYIENSDSVFEIGSVTKTFTGTMLAKLVYDGKVNPNEPVNNLLPVKMNQSARNGIEMTLVHLANHTSGLPFEPPDVRKVGGQSFDKYDPYRSYDIPRLYQYLSHDMVLQSAPGEKRTYSNLGFGLIGHLLTLIARTSYEELMQQAICRPLGMERTFVLMSEERRKMMVQGRDEKGALLPFSDGDMGAFTGCGAIKSSARDLVKYLRANMTDTTYFLLAQQSTKQYDEHLTGSLAWATYSENGKHHVGAFGATGGYTCGVIFERNEQVGVVVLTNVSAYLASQGNYTEGLCRALYDPLPYVAGKTARNAITSAP